MRWVPLGAAALALAVLAGCSSGPEQSASTGAPASPPASAPKGEYSAPGSEAVPKLDELEAKLKGSPKDAKLKVEAAEAYYQAGHAMMLNPDLPPRQKYRGALKLFRRSLALDPNNAGAAADKKQIEDIYVQMGRPIPT